jgi:hypothetical protein
VRDEDAPHELATIDAALACPSFFAFSAAF